MCYQISLLRAELLYLFQINSGKKNITNSFREKMTRTAKGGCINSVNLHSPCNIDFIISIYCINIILVLFSWIPMFFAIKLHHAQTADNTFMIEMIFYIDFHRILQTYTNKLFLFSRFASSNLSFDPFLAHHALR